MQFLRRALGLATGALALSIFCSAIALAGTSNNFRIDESFIGPGGVLDSSSAGFQLQSGQQAIGNIAVGGGESSNFQVKNGYVTTPDPRLECLINTPSISFGSFSTSVTSTATATFSVMNYTSYGYIVSILGNTPRMGTHNLTNLSANAASTPGTEQFGINLAANTSPTTFGSAPVQVPDNTFSYGNAATNYNTSNSYRYNNGDTIASATKSSGQTNYTISYIANVATTTPGGTYTGNQTILCTGTY